MKKICNYFFFNANVLRGIPLALALCSFQATEINDEYAVKGMFIYNFTKYIDWSGSDQGDHFVIAVYGKSEITKSLEQIAVNKKVNNKTLVIRTVTNAEQAADCQVIFIPRTNNVALGETIARLGSKGILIVTEDKDMALKGACINIIIVEGKIKFELSETAVKRDGLKIANQLASLAIHVK